MRGAKQPNLSPLLYLHFRFWARNGPTGPV
jgi:hypothetical protein